MASSWYKRAEKQRKPYKVVVIVHGDEQIPEVLTNERIYAYSSEQARKLFLDRYSSLHEYLEMGYSVEVRFDKTLWEENETMRKMKEQLEEERIQNAWWQD